MFRPQQSFARYLLICSLVFYSGISLQAAEWGTLSGKIVYTGEPVKQRKGPFPEAPSLVVGPQGGLKNVFVYLRDRDYEGKPIHPDFQKLPDTVVLHHRGSLFEPHATGLWQPHQKLVVLNQDRILHFTHFFPIINRFPASLQENTDRKKIIRFQDSEIVPMQVKCDIHPWETGYLLVQNHPYFSLTDESGSFSIKNLPVGEWDFQFWHEKAGHLVNQDGPKRGRITVQIKPGNNDLGQFRITPRTLELKRPSRMLPAAGLVLTFDDRNMNQWIKQIPLFQKYNARVSFFVDHFHTLTPEQLAALKKLQAAGHTIGCHGAKHRKAVDYVKAHGMERYLQDEILPAVQEMNDAGLKPTCFAYPSSSRNEEIDSELLKIFRHLRGGTGLSSGRRMRDLQPIFVSTDQIEETGCLIGTGIDYAGTEKRPDYLTEIKDALDHAKTRGEIVVFYAHNISDQGPGHHLQPRVLEAILDHAQQIDLPTLTYDELP